MRKAEVKLPLVGHLSGAKVSQMVVEHGRAASISGRRLRRSGGGFFCGGGVDSRDIFGGGSDSIGDVAALQKKRTLCGILEDDLDALRQDRSILEEAVWKFRFQFRCKLAAGPRESLPEFVSGTAAFRTFMAHAARVQIRSSEGKGAIPGKIFGPREPLLGQDSKHEQERHPRGQL